MMTSERRRLTGGCAIAVVLLLAGFSATARQPGAASGPSRLVDVGGHRLEALVSGEGVPAVVFEAGFIGGLHWMRALQDAVAERTMTVAYNRAGLGQSEPGPEPRASGTDFRKAGAVNALYWAHVPLTFPGGAPSFDIEYATPASRAEYEGLQDIWTRRQLLFLEAFVGNANVDVRRSIVPSLDVDPQKYPESHRSLVHQAIRIARSHDDEYIRHRIEVQLGDDSDGLAPLPHRDRHEPTA